uniref:immunity protein Imm33 domain-containing protein n=1 Tax=Nocardia sp. XZ_19_385 TaxID=2769488 RepID=UPI00188FF4D9
MMLQRHEYVEDDESGWFAGCLDAEHEHDQTSVHLCTLYELAVMTPGIVGYLALPPGCTVTLGEGAPSIWRGDAALEIRSGSLLASMFGD